MPQTLSFPFPGGWQMEAIKRRLDVLAALLAPAGRVALLGLPPAEDVFGQFRVAGLEALFAAQGLRLVPLQQAEAAIWLGAAPPPPDALPRPAPQRLLLWPAPDAAAAILRAPAGELSPPPLLCLPEPGLLAACRAAGADYACLLPDPSHALWGLLDHHPMGEGELALPGSDWRGLLPASRLAPLRVWPGTGRLARLARARLVEAARRRLAMAARLQGGGIGESILAALLGRPCSPAAEAAPRVAAYWQGWAEGPAAADQAA